MRIKILIIAGLILFALPGHSSAQTAPTGETPADLQMVITQNGLIKPGVPSLQVVFRNVSDRDVDIYLGDIGGWSPRPCKLDNRETTCTFNFNLNVADGTGAQRSYTFRGASYVAGAFGPYTVHLRPHDTYTLELGIDQFHSPATREYQPLALAPGACKISLEFAGLAPSFPNADPQHLAKFWKGKLTSNFLSIEIAGAGQQPNPHTPTRQSW